jgi:tripartite-type tricarboxylate transporter receptor subunit TctC
VSDWTARLIGEKLAAGWGQQVIVENLTGAGGVLGTQAIAKAPPDGYVIGMMASNHPMNAAAYRSLPYDAVADFKPVIHTSFNQFLFCVNAAVPAKTLQEFIALAKAKPSELNYSSSGNGGSPHLAVEKLAYMAGIKVTHIPYRSNGAAITDLVSGQVAMMATSISTLLPHVKTGKLRALAVSGDARSPLVPDVPTVAESGVPGYSMKNWNGIVGPAHLSPSIVARLQQDVVSILKDKTVADQFAGQGVEIEVLMSDDFGRRIVDDIAAWQKVVQASGLKVE